MEAGKKKSSAILAHMENATKKYPRVFQPFEIAVPARELEQAAAWEVVNADDPDVDLAPSSVREQEYDVDAESCIVRIAHPAFRSQGSEPLDIESFMRPQRLPPINSRRPTVPSGGAVDMVLPAHLAMPSMLATLTPPALAPFTIRPKAPGAQRAPMPKAYIAGAAAFFLFACFLFGASLHYRHSAKHHRMTNKVVEAPLVAAIAPLDAPAKNVALEPTSQVGLKEARAAFASGDFDQASIIFAELAQDSNLRLDAMTGLADVAKARGDLEEANARYKAILAGTPGYLPARLGLADTTWDSHDYPSARMQYASIAKAYPAGTFPKRVTLRMK